MVLQKFSTYVWSQLPATIPCLLLAPVKTSLQQSFPAQPTPNITSVLRKTRRMSALLRWLREPEAQWSSAPASCRSYKTESHKEAGWRVWIQGLNMHVTLPTRHESDSLLGYNPQVIRKTPNNYTVDKTGRIWGGGSEQLTNQLTPNQRLKISVATCSLLSINNYSPFVSLTTGCSTYAAFPQTWNTEEGWDGMN